MVFLSELNLRALGKGLKGCETILAAPTLLSALFLILRDRKEIDNDSNRNN